MFILSIYYVQKTQSVLVLDVDSNDYLFSNISNHNGEQQNVYKNFIQKYFI